MFERCWEELKRTEECTQWRDDGYQTCSSWAKDCCDWWPCSWGCKLVSWLCVAWVWVSHKVCVGWKVIKTVVCIPVTIAIAIGTIGLWLWDLVETVLSWVMSLGDVVLGALGIIPEKKLRICVIIPRDSTGALVWPVAPVVALLQEGANILMDTANVRLLPAAGARAARAKVAETVSDEWVRVLDERWAEDLLNVECNAMGFWRDLGPAGTAFRTARNCCSGSLASMLNLGRGAPVACFVVRSIPPGTKWDACGSYGCGLFLTDYITIRPQPCGGAAPSAGTNWASGFARTRVVAHELAHACGLWHMDPTEHPDNLMSTGQDTKKLYRWQVMMLRASKHVTYL